MLRMSAEWESQQAVWFAWPCSDKIWLDQRSEIKEAFAKMLSAVASETKVNLICAEPFQLEAKSFLEKHQCRNCDFIDLVTDDVWCRDFGPLFVEKDKEQVLLNWGFNAWGGKFEDYAHDNAIPEKLGELLEKRIIEPGLILEGGAIEVNGAGLTLTTESVLLNENRNKGLTKEQIEQALKEYMGIEEVIWLRDGLVNDDTDGHIDNISRFVGERTVVTCVSDETNPNYEILEENKRNLQAYRFADGGALRVIDLPLPDPIYLDGEILPASYANFLISNKAVFVPSFDQEEKDQLAQEVLAKSFPKHKIIAIDCRVFLLEGGAIHCLSQQQPFT